MIVGCPSSYVRRQQLLQRTSPPKLLDGFLTKLGRNDPYMALFKNCSNGSGPLHIDLGKLGFKMKTLKHLLVRNHKA